METLVAENGKTRYEAELFELFYVLELTRYYTGRAGRRALPTSCTTRSSSPTSGRAWSATPGAWSA